MEGPTQDSVLRPDGFTGVSATNMSFFKNRYEMISHVEKEMRTIELENGIILKQQIKKQRNN